MLIVILYKVVAYLIVFLIIWALADCQLSIKSLSHQNKVLYEDEKFKILCSVKLIDIESFQLMVIKGKSKTSCCDVDGNRRAEPPEFEMCHKIGLICRPCDLIREEQQLRCLVEVRASMNTSGIGFSCSAGGKSSEILNITVSGIVLLLLVFLSIYIKIMSI